MNKKLIFNFLLLTFSIMIIFNGLLLVLGQLGILINDHIWLYVPYIVGGLSTIIASYFVLKNNNIITGFIEWIKNIFTIKTSIKYYVFTILLYLTVPVMFVLIPPGLEKMEPVYLFFALLPVMVIGGGLEEAGWRYILQPELEKKFKFILSAIIIAPIWALWHLPLFFIPGLGQYGTSFGIFTIGVIGLTFAIGAVRKITGNVFLCVLFHAMVNAGYGVFIFENTLYKNIIITTILIILSILSVIIYERKKKVM